MATALYPCIHPHCTEQLSCTVPRVGGPKATDTRSLQECDRQYATTERDEGRTFSELEMEIFYRVRIRYKYVIHRVILFSIKEKTFCI